MKYSNLFIILVIIILSTPYVLAGEKTLTGSDAEEMDGDCVVYFPENFGKDKTRVIKCIDDSSDGADEYVEITSEDNCKVTCTDPRDPSQVYTIKAYGQVQIKDVTDDKIDHIDITVESTDPYGNTNTLYNTYIEGSYEGEDYIGRGIVAFFSPYVEQENLVAYTDPSAGLHVYSDYYYESVFDKYTSTIWTLFYASDLTYQITANRIFEYYEHKFDFDTCKDTFLEFYYCGSDGYDGICPYDSNTAYLGCYMHNENTEDNRAIVSVDAEGGFVGDW